MDVTEGTAPKPIPVIDKAIMLLQVFGPDEQWLGLAEIARRLDMPRSSVHRLAARLVAHRLLSADGAGNYALGVGLVELGTRALASRALTRVVQPFLRRLVAECNETCHVAVLDGNESMYVARETGNNVVTVQSHIGQRVPALFTATGKALLAWQSPDVTERVLSTELARYTAKTVTSKSAIRKDLEETRQRGFSLNFEQWQLDTVGTAAPIRDHTGAVTAAIGVAGPSYRLDRERLTEAGRMAAGVAADISRALGYLADTGGNPDRRAV